MSHMTAQSADDQLHRECGRPLSEKAALSSWKSRPAGNLADRLDSKKGCCGIERLKLPIYMCMNINMACGHMDHTVYSLIAHAAARNPGATALRRRSKASTSLTTPPGPQDSMAFHGHPPASRSFSSVRAERAVGGRLRPPGSGDACGRAISARLG